MHEYTLIRSKRRTLSIQIGKGGEIIARAPLRMPLSVIEVFIQSKSDWIEKHVSRVKQSESRIEQKVYSQDEIRSMKRNLMDYLTTRVDELWKGRGLPEYTSLKVTKSERRWGSCSGKNGLCFSYRLAEYLPSPLSFSGADESLGFDKEKSHGVDSSLRQNDSTEKTRFIDAIIYHELAHLREKHHRPKFWKLVYSMMPEYEEVMRHQKGYRD